MSEARKRLMLAQLHKLPPKQFGDACEYLILSELALAGWHVIKMPDGWSGHDVLVSRPNGENIRISVKGLRAGNGRRAGYWNVGPDVEGWDWVALLRISVETGKRDVYLVPRAQVLEWTAGLRKRAIYCNNRPAIERFRDNFALDPAGLHGGQP